MGVRPERDRPDPRLVTRRLEGERARGQDARRAAVGPAHPSRAREVDAAHDRGDPGEQLLLAEGLDEVVVRADAQGLDLGGLGALAGDDEDGDVARRAQLADDGEPVRARHREVEQDEVRPLLAEALDGGQAVVGGDDLVALGADQGRDGSDHRRVVVDDQDAEGSRSDHQRCLAFLRRRRRPAARARSARRRWVQARTTAVPASIPPGDARRRARCRTPAP